MPKRRTEAISMKTKKRPTAAARSKTPRQTRTEKEATKNFFPQLQQAVDQVEWGKVKLPKLRD